jgi:NADH-quinone oxidoreductase subunit L
MQALLLAAAGVRLRKVAAGVALGASILTGVALSFAPVESVDYQWLPGVALGHFVLLPPDVVAWVVVLVAGLVQLFSARYMADDPDLSRYYALLGLFQAAMLLLVMAGDLLLLFVGWELVGISSYLLIGFWHADEAPRNASLKALLVNRVGDAALLGGLLLLLALQDTLRLSGLVPLAADGKPLLAAGLLAFGALAKAAQLPLHTWLPDAMAGPTPVSALLHAATMVAAGALLLIRLAPILPPPVRLFIGVIGGLGAVYGGLCALAQWDLKRILAYSTLSQLGLMLVGVSAAAPAAAQFHLLTHAGFKAGLFLVAAVIIHLGHHLAHHTDTEGETPPHDPQDIRQ